MSIERIKKISKEFLEDLVEFRKINTDTCKEVYDRCSDLLERAYRAGLQNGRQEPVYIHYGSEAYDPEKFQPIRNRMHTNKPYGGLWASDMYAEYGWKEWCERNDFQACSLDKSFSFRLKQDARILLIDSKEKAEEVIQREADGIAECGIRVSYPVLPDFEKISEHYDVIDFRISEDSRLCRTLYGWDCDSILILNPDVVVPIQTKRQPEKLTAREFASELQAVIKSGKTIADMNGGIGIGFDYQDWLTQKEMAGLFCDSSEYDGNTPRERFYSLIDRRVDSYADYYKQDVFQTFVCDYMSDQAYAFWEEDQDAAIETMREYLYFCYPEEQLNTDVCVNILLDTGNGNYDFSLDDVLNHDRRFKEESSLLFLAKTQGKEKELIKAVTEYANGTCSDPFVASCIEEMENNGSSLNTVTFCVKMSLFEAFDLWDFIFEKPGEGRNIIVSKDARAGLFNPFDGGGSLLEIKLDKDVVIPAGYIFSMAPDGRWDAEHYWDVGETYDVISRFWKGTAKPEPEQKAERTA